MATLKIQHHINKQLNFKIRLSDTYHSKILFDPPLRLMEIKTKANKRDLIIKL